MDDSPEEGVTNLRNLESLKAKSDFFFCEVALPGLRHRGKPDPERGLAPCHFNHHVWVFIEQFSDPKVCYVHYVNAFFLNEGFYSFKEMRD